MRNTDMTKLEAENKRLKERLEILSGKTNFCAQCEAYAREIEKLVEGSEMSCDCYHCQRQTKEKERQRFWLVFLIAFPVAYLAAMAFVWFCR